MYIDTLPPVCREMFDKNAQFCCSLFAFGHNLSNNSTKRVSLSHQYVSHEKENNTASKMYSLNVLSQLTKLKEPTIKVGR